MLPPTERRKNRAQDHDPRPFLREIAAVDALPPGSSVAVCQPQRQDQQRSANNMTGPAGGQIEKLQEQGLGSSALEGDRLIRDISGLRNKERVAG